jgi:transketolase
MESDKALIKDLEERSRILRLQLFDSARKIGGYHYGGSLSCIEILVCLYKKTITKDDIFLLSKGHAALSLYPLLQECGYNPKVTEHPDFDCENGLHCTSGSLGMGLPMAVGRALARKIQNKPGRIFVLLGEAECQEGTTWESLLIASQHKLDNLVVIIDRNDNQGSGNVNKILSLGNLESKFISFGCYVETIDGHSHEQLLNSFNNLKPGKCNVIIANTIKGKGAKIMEQEPHNWHAKTPAPEEFKKIYEDLGGEYK